MSLVENLSSALSNGRAPVPPLLETRGLSVAYGQRTVLEDVSLTLGGGELVGMVGPNGAGKSTFIRAVSRLVPLTRGEVLLSGIDISRFSRRELAGRLAVVPQNSVLPETFAALEVVLLGRTARLGLLQSETRADLEAARQAMQATGVWGLSQRPLDELSGGERQRVLLACALAQGSPLLLLDEPTTHLDVSHQASILSLLLSLCRDGGRAALVVVHDLTLAAQICQRLVFLHHGRIIAEGPPERVLSQQLLDSVYRADAQVLAHPLTGKPIVLPVPREGLP
ncbi:MAG TPA: ABC transporter ATP-binding protein [Dehalococcoidia bacterium]|nr:ABC transporter ATP-binding protein [Dehalococcoidia bacterium]